MVLLKDYSNILSIVQKELARRYERQQDLLNVPGKSIACKIDINYYLILYPSFIEFICKACGLLPRTLIETLIKTGNMIVDPATKEFYKPIEVKWDENMSPIKIRAAFVISSFIDNSIRFYGTLSKQALPISPLQISKKYISYLSPLFTNKTPLNSRVFFD